jgi:hypothetical protein
MGGLTKHILLTVTVLFLARSVATACPLERAVYRLAGHGNATLRIGGDPTGDTIFAFKTASEAKSINLAAVIDRVRIVRMNRHRQLMNARTKVAPAFIQLRGFNETIGFGDGEWRLSACSAHGPT